MNWLRDKLKLVEPLYKFWFCGTAERFTWIELLLAMKNGCIIRSPNEKNPGFKKAKQQHPIARPVRFRKKTMPSVWWNQKEILCYVLFKSRETGNRHLYRQQRIDLNNALLKKGTNWTRYTKEWYYRTSMFRAIGIPSFRTPLKLWNRIC